MLTDHHVRKMVKAVFRHYKCAGKKGRFAPRAILVHLTLQALCGSNVTPRQFRYIETQIEGALDRGIKRKWIKVKRGYGGGYRLRQKD